MGTEGYTLQKLHSQKINVLICLQHTQLVQLVKQHGDNLVIKDKSQPHDSSSLQLLNDINYIIFSTP